jgi:UDP-N-acetylglucosamine 1-carboxyvinyltransferase
MDKIAIIGGNQLNGTIKVSGAKNSALKLQAASLLTSEPCVFTNMPELADTRFMVELLEQLGVTVYWPKGSGRMQTHVPEIRSTIAPYDLVRKMRATFNVLGPLLAREGHATVSLPGGCAIGARPVDLHLKALEAMGADIVIEGGYVKASALRGLTGAKIVFPFVSVGATEHAMLAATLAHGETILENAAREPEIVDIANCLIQMGAKIEGAGTPTIRIQGVTSLKGVNYKVIPDRIEAGTYACVVAATGGSVVLDDLVPDTLNALWDVLKKAGVNLEFGDDWVKVSRDPNSPLKAVDIDTQPHPGFPTDLQAQFMGLMTIAEGTSIFRENIFENRFMHAPELRRLGADISVRGNEAVVRGLKSLKGAQVMATDLRASVSLVIAGLVAEGETLIGRVYHLDRGFENLEEKLTNCGAKISRQTGE